VNVYLAASMTTPAHEIGVVAAVLAEVEAAGHFVPTRHVARPGSLEQDAELSNRELAERDLSWVASCHALIAEASTPSHGVAVEVMAARQCGIPVLLLHRRGVRVSRLLLGLTGVQVHAYSGRADACSAARSFLAAARGAIVGLA
jgi:hypothetical protein